MEAIADHVQARTNVQRHSSLVANKGDRDVPVLLSYCVA